MDGLVAGFSELWTFLEPWVWVAVVWSACVPVMGGYAWVAYRRRVQRGTPSATARRASILEALVVLAALPPLLVMLSPTGDSLSHRLVALPTRGLELLRGATTVDSLRQIVGNLLAFTVLGAVLPLRWPLRLLDVALATASLTIVVETLQLVAIPGRVASVDDVLLATAGALIGAAITSHWWVARRQDQQ